MKDLNYYVDKYKEQLEKGDIQEAYIGLVKYVTKLGTTFSKTFQTTIHSEVFFRGIWTIHTSITQTIF